MRDDRDDEGKFAPHIPTAETRQIVQLHATIGTPHDMIARVVGIDPKTMRKWYRDELDLAHARANAAIGGALFNKAKNGDTAAQIFWMKTRAGFRETSTHNHTSSDGSMSPNRIELVSPDDDGED